MELLDKLGIDWRLLIAQIVNFLILLGVLYKILYRPLVQMLEERRAKIQKSFSDAQEAHEARTRAESEKQVVISEAHREAHEIIAKARAEALELKSAIVEEGKAEKLELVAAARRQAEDEKIRAMKEAEGSIGGLVVKLTKKLIGDVLTKEQDRKLADKVFGLKIES